MSKPKITIILSTYNEEKDIKNTIKNILYYIKNVEIIVVDDNSKDKTFEILKKLKNKNIKIFSRKKAKGLASAFLLGLINSRGQIIGWVDSNMGNVVKLFPKMIDNLKEYDVVILSRFIKNGKDNRNLLRKFSSYFLNKFTKFVLQSKINDLSSGIFVMHRRVLLDVVPIARGHGEFMIEFLHNAEVKNNKIKEIPYSHPVDKNNNSKSNPNLIKFFVLGFFYLLRIIQILLKKI